MHFSSVTFISLLTLAASASALIPSEDLFELLVRSTGDCSGTGSASTGASCESNSSAVGFIADGESTCMSKKMAGGSVYKHKNGKCYQPKPKKQVRFARRQIEELVELAARSSGDCSGTGSSSTGSACESNSSAVGFIADGETTCRSKKEAGGSVYKHKNGKCDQPKPKKQVRFARRDLEEFDELSARSSGDCTGTGSSSTGSACESNSSAVGFIADGETTCRSKKEAGGSLYKHKNGKCYQPKPKKQVRFARRQIEELVELAARSSGDCSGTGSSSTGSACESNSSAVGFIADGETTCRSKKEAGGSLYKHKSGKCYQPKPKKSVRFARRQLEELAELAARHLAELEELD